MRFVNPLYAPYVLGIKTLMGIKKTKPGKVLPLQEARQIAMIRDSREKVRHSKGTIRKSKGVSAVSRNTISSSRELAICNRDEWKLSWFRTER